MAAIALQNPKLVKGTMEYISVPSAAVTWKSGQFLFVSGGHATAAASNAVNLKYYALSDQDAAPSAGDLVKVGVLTSSQIFEINETAASTIDDTDINVPYAIIVASNKVTVDSSDTSNDCLLITELASNYNPFKYTSADTNARCRVKVIQAVIDAA